MSEAFHERKAATKAAASIRVRYTLFAGDAVAERPFCRYFCLAITMSLILL